MARLRLAATIRINACGPLLHRGGRDLSRARVSDPIGVEYLLTALDQSESTVTKKRVVILQLNNFYLAQRDVFKVSVALGVRACSSQYHGAGLPLASFTCKTARHVPHDE